MAKHTKTLFKDPRCGRLYDLAGPKGDKYLHCFAWREEPKDLDKHWNKYVEQEYKTEQEKDEFLKELILSAQAQTRYRREQLNSGSKLCRPKGIAVWFNKGCWDDGIGSHSDLKQKQENKETKGCKCGQPSFNGVACCECFGRKLRDWRGTLLAAKRDELGLQALPGESKAQRRERCVKVARLLGLNQIIGKKII